MAADMGQPPPPGSKNPKDYVTTKILNFFQLKFGYELEAKIAAGNFGKVFKAIHHGSSDHAPRSGLGSTGVDTPVAVKMMELNKLPSDVKNVYLGREIEALKTVKHNNAIRIYDIMVTKDRAWFFMEFAPKGDIQGFIVKRGAALDDPLAGYWMNQILSALEALHDHYKMAHRDLKLENVMLGRNWEAKVADFGFARSIGSPQDHQRSVKSITFCGTPAYESIQILLKQPYDPAKADMWATGVMLYAMMTMKLCFTVNRLLPDGKLQYDKPTQIDSIQRETHKQRIEWQTLEPDCQTLINKMLTINEAERPTAARCRKSKWATRYLARPAELDKLGG